MNEMGHKQATPVNAVYAPPRTVVVGDRLRATIRGHGPCIVTVIGIEAGAGTNFGIFVTTIQKDRYVVDNELLAAGGMCTHEDGAPIDADAVRQALIDHGEMDPPKTPKVSENHTLNLDKQMERISGLGARVRAARERLGLSTRDVDERAGLTPGHTYAIEVGDRKDPRGSTISALSRALRVTLDWLLDGPSEKEGEG